MLLRLLPLELLLFKQVLLSMLQLPLRHFFDAVAAVAFATANTNTPSNSSMFADIAVTTEFIETSRNNGIFVNQESHRSLIWLYCDCSSHRRSFSSVQI